MIEVFSLRLLDFYFINFYLFIIKKFNTTNLLIYFKQKIVEEY